MTKQWGSFEKLNSPFEDVRDVGAHNGWRRTRALGISFVADDITRTGGSRIDTPEVPGPRSISIYFTPKRRTLRNYTAAFVRRFVRRLAEGSALIRVSRSSFIAPVGSRIMAYSVNVFGSARNRRRTDSRKTSVR